MKYDRIEIHFRTEKGAPRMVVIDPVTEVRGIRLETIQGNDPPNAKGLHLVGGEVAPGDGPMVCYETEIGLVCW